MDDEIIDAWQEGRIIKRDESGELQDASGLPGESGKKQHFPQLPGVGPAGEPGKEQPFPTPPKHFHDETPSEDYDSS